MHAQFHWDPETYLDLIHSEVPRYDELQEQTIAAIPFPPKRVLELGSAPPDDEPDLGGIPDARITGLDSSPEMVFKARELGWEEMRPTDRGPLPDGRGTS